MLSSIYIYIITYSVVSFMIYDLLKVLSDSECSFEHFKMG